LILPPGGPISHHKLILVHLEAIRWCIRAAELEPTALPWGVKAGEVPLRVALNHSINCYAQVQKVVRDLAGGHVTTNQTYHDLNSAEIGPWVERCFAGTVDGRERFALMNLIEDLAASEYATRKEQFLVFSLGPPMAKKLGLYRAYDFEPLVAKVRATLALD